MEVEDDVEEDDMDFNPFLREGTPPSEASSSLTSENEGSGTSSDMEFMSGMDRQEDNALSMPKEQPLSDSLQIGIANGNAPLHNGLPFEGGGGGGDVQENPLSNAPCDNGNDASDGFEGQELVGRTACPLDMRNSQQLVLEVNDEEDAICRRTRARFSLANYTLEELETFLQESDDEGDLQNVDEEEEYHKFLSAVLLEGGDDVPAGPGDENLDEDENDADFELEIEEALESDGDENAENYEDTNGRKEEDGRRPQTRQKKRLNETSGMQNHLYRQVKIPLRPILPYISAAQLASSPDHGLQLPNSSYSSLSMLCGANLTNGFTDQQMGQLHVLIHEHVQLLIQTFSLCILDPSRQQTAAEVQKMIVEMVGRREGALAWRNVPHRASCFETSYLCPSFSENFGESHQSHWVPLIDNPVITVLDVTPLRLATSYLNDVMAAAMRYRRSHLDGTADKSHLRKEPLFPRPVVSTPMEANNGYQGESSTTSSASPNSLGQPQHKKSLAATLVESTKKESVALVPVDIARLAQRFFPLFNFALFPHKPPLPTLANRVHFTDAEDGLLALGLLEYNNDWGAIQRRFLPCKSMHQIFVRQKNRSSSKAPENPIKAVRRMKTSPLTIEEKERIQQGLKVFKNDWTSVWKFFVPHRDPSLLPRQWRIAIGTQKSYGKSEAEKEKRRLYEAKRRKLRASVVDSYIVPGHEVDNDGTDCADRIDNDDDAYVNEAFLAESENRGSSALSYDLSLSSLARNGIQPTDTMIQIGTNAGEECVSGTDEGGDLQKGNSTSLELASSKPLGATNNLSNPSNAICSASVATSSKNSSSLLRLRPTGSSLISLPPPMCKDKGTLVVKLAPDLPPVNLPPSVRVISQLEFQGHQNVSSYSNTDNSAAKDLFPIFPRAFTQSACTANSSKQLNLFPDHGIGVSLQRDGGAVANATGNSSEPDFQMHPLLFQYPQEQFSLYNHPTPNPIDASGKYGLFPCSRDHVEKINDRTSASLQKETPGDANTIDFHPLLQRNEVRFYGEGGVGDCPQFINPSDCNLRALVDGQSRTRQASACTDGRENNLDLDIHLCSSRDFTIAKEDHRDTSVCQSETRTFCSERRMVENGTHTCAPNCKDKHLDVCSLSKSNVQAEGCGKEGTNVDEPEVGNTCAGRYRGESNEDSMQGIVMEQEELSDSDEDSEHVEFECEEMDDSDEEEFHTTQPAETQNKGFPTFAALGELQATHEHNQILPPKLVEQGSIQVGSHCPSSTQKFQGSSPARSARAKPRQETAKHARSRTNQSASASRPHESDRGKTKNSKAEQGQAVTERKSTASRRPRKNSALS